ncbi:MAG: acyltransferase [Bacteroidales bacterium]|jgi:acetyltransferase-like isoleucine patch superfamily enzyme|nr:acyltransferase [Bacteroidales bacterium]
MFFRELSAVLFRIRRYLCLFCLKFQNLGQLKYSAANDPDALIRKAALVQLGCIIGEDVHINPGVQIVIDYPDEAPLVLHDRVAIAPNVIFICNSGPMQNSILQTNCDYAKNSLIIKGKIEIGNDSWIGAGVIILPGVTIGAGVIIGANSVMKSDAPPYTVWAGSPARKIKDLQISGL